MYSVVDWSIILCANNHETGNGTVWWVHKCGLRYDVHLQTRTQATHWLRKWSKERESERLKIRIILCYKQVIACRQTIYYNFIANNYKIYNNNYKAGPRTSNISYGRLTCHIMETVLVRVDVQLHLNNVIPTCLRKLLPTAPVLERNTPPSKLVSNQITPKILTVSGLFASRSTLSNSYVAFHHQRS